MTAKAWFLAARPKTLVAGVVPVAVGSSLAFRDGHFSWAVAAAALIGALFIQVGTNLANDYFDFKKGADTSKRLGPPRATQQGWLTPRAVLTGSLVCFAMSFLIGLYLVSVAGLPMLIIGITSILAGYAYTGGPYPLAYHGLGDVFVLVFFGFVAVCATYFAHTGGVSPIAFAAAVPVGLLGVALLAVNNTRDEETDAEAGKRTLVVRFGRRFGQLEYVTAIAISALVPVLLWASGSASAWVLASLASLPLAIPPLRLVWRERGPVLNDALAGTAKLQLVFGALLAGGLTQ
ncbi:MAG: 1,4-dihydroxy-2-naphthoate polyprenyltransferase [Archangium sp.]|nr:1,4-dihydroxy-2-naphthoate polyprenyltransferase [Archangium sp.]